MTSLNFSCPHCHHEYEDDIECLDKQLVNTMICEHCTEQFILYFDECIHCNKDSVFIYLNESDVPSTTQFACVNCGSVLNELMEDDGEQGNIGTM